MPHQFPSRIIAPLLVILFTATLASLHLQYRTITGDEVPYTDPAIRLVTGKGWTSIAWAPSSETFFVGNFPAYPLLLAAAFSIAHPDLSTARLLSHLLFAASFLLLLAAGRRWQWFPNWKWETAWLIVCLFGLYIFPVAQYARPDAWALFLVCLATFLCSLPPSRATGAALLLNGFLAGASGLQLVPVLGILGLVFIGLTRRWKPVLLVAVGGACGLLGTFAVMAAFSMAAPFWESTFGMGSDRWAQWHGWRDPLLWSASLLLLTAPVFAGKNPLVIRCATWGLLSGIGIAGTLFALGKFPNYYAFFASIPASIAAFVLLSRIPRGPFRAIGILCLSGSAILGFPLVSLMVWNTWEQRDLHRFEEWVWSHIDPGSKVVATPIAYYAALRAGATIRTDFMCRQTDSVADADRLLLMKDDPWIRNWEHSTQWKIVAQYDARGTIPSRLTALDILNRLSFSPQYQLEIWEKIKTP